MIDIPPMFSGPAGQIITALQLLITATSYSAEVNAKTRAQYAKFSQAKENDESKTWPSKVAMMVIYTPALIASVSFLALRIHGVTQIGPLTIPSPSLAAVFCAIHFAKRCLEVLFLHKFSGRTGRDVPSQIAVFYTLVTILVICAAGRNDYDATTNMLQVGSVLFGIGIVGNFYHHYLLATLRSGSSAKYVAPKGGLFSYVAAPHYLFELIGWLGIAVVSNHLNAYLVFAGMTSYLSGRSVAQNDFNRRKFDDEWPANRKNLIPFIF